MKHNESIPVNSLRNENYIEHVKELLYVYIHLGYSTKIDLFCSEDRNLAPDQTTHLVTQIVEFTHRLINLFTYKVSIYKNLIITEFNLIFLVHSEPVKNIKIKNFSIN